MTEQSLTTRIETTPEQIFDFVCDIDRWPEWDAFADEILSASERPLVAGSTYRERSGRDESDWKVVEFERPHRQVHVGDVPFLGPVTVEMTLHPVEDGTEFEHAISYRVMPRLRPLGWLIERLYVDRYALKGMRRTRDDAKRLIESEAASPVADPIR